MVAVQRSKAVATGKVFRPRPQPMEGRTPPQGFIPDEIKDDRERSGEGVTKIPGVFDSARDALPSLMTTQQR
jgi:hypothetical protein